MLDPAEAAAVAGEFGVTDDQVRRDHLLSHLLAVLSSQLPDAVVFLAGRRSRTHLPHGRLSEDLDLYALPRRADVAADVEKVLADGVRREYGRLTWDHAAGLGTRRRSGGTAYGRRAQRSCAAAGPAHYPDWPTERCTLVQRYRDAPAATLAVPSPPAFAAAKTAAWHDRRAPRDLYDLWGLARPGLLDMHAAELFAQFGPTGLAPQPWIHRPAALAQLGHRARRTAPDRGRSSGGACSRPRHLDGGTRTRGLEPRRQPRLDRTCK